MKSGKQKNDFSFLKIYVPLLLIAINIFVFFYFKNKGEDIPETLVLSPYNLFIEKNLPCLITSGFLHKDIFHLGFNCLGIFIFGSIVQNRFGAVKTLLIYFGALVLSMLFATTVYSLIMHKNTSLIGASGALMGFISCAMLADPFKISYEIAFLPIPVMFKGWFYFYADIRGFLGGEKDGVSHLAHLFGFLSIALIVYFLNKNDRKILLNGLLINIFSFIIFLGLWNYIAKLT